MWANLIGLETVQGAWVLLQQVTVSLGIARILLVIVGFPFVSTSLEFTTSSYEVVLKV